jgi:lipopolysaccharide transport system ATP-binding protein
MSFEQAPMDAISVENLSKKYLIRKGNSESYTTLRDTLAKGIRSLGRRLIEPVSGETSEFWALKDVTFEVKQGERIGIIGRNGAGKSTLLKVLSRVTAPTKGRVKITGRVASLLEVGTGFHAELSGRENVYLNGAVLGMRRLEIARKFDEIVAFSGIGDFIDTPVKRYSSGMYVRLAFSIAAHIDPDVLIVDEVLAVGDMEFQQRCLSRMKELEAAGRTVLFVTHNMDAMVALCDRGIVLDRGQIVFDGSAADGRNTYIEMQSAREYSIVQNAGRGGSALARVHSVSIDGLAPDRAPLITTGSGITIHVTFSGTEGLPADAPLELGIGIDTSEGVRLFTSVSSWHGVTYAPGRREGKAVCEIKSLPVISGTYLVSVALIFRGETLDAIRHCASFKVVTAGQDIYENRLAGHGAFDLPCTFR